MRASPCTLPAVVALAAMTAVLMAAGQGPVGTVDGSEWRVYGGSPANDRYSPLREITPANVAGLEEAWRFDTGETGGFQVNPIVVRGVLYSPTPSHRVVALDAATGALKWTFDSKLQSRGPNRGVTYWESGSEQRLFVAADQYLYALDAATGAPIVTFGEQGRLDLRRGLGRDPATQFIRLTTPGIVYKDVLIIGGRAGEGAGASPGDIRAFDVRTGALKWSFHTIPHPGEEGYRTWSETSWKVNGGANNWAGMALDVARGVVFVPTGSAAPDFYGADRVGDNLFANCVLALDAATGRRLWHFQAVHHDIWDRDFPAPPTLVTVRRDGRTIDAVAQTTKQGFVFVLDRETGTPVFPVEERPMPASRVPGERVSRTQPVPLLPEPFARQRLTAELLTQRTPEAHAWAVAEFAKMHTEGPFTPLQLGKDTVVFPGFDGGAEWGGSAYDPTSGRLFVNANDLAWTGALSPNDAGTNGASPSAPTGRLRFTGYKKFLDPDGYPATAPPWGTLSAIDLNTGALTWRIPLGDTPSSLPAEWPTRGPRTTAGPS